ncbi:hypothetical protein Metme_0560 [Methylomonas methanica MC09]|uniref:Uncharacterized protein n=1 Tax=Methylomonas methanica (strain DSM 25384 / MC09) TaxID=857087 RepID=G0A372_METMM|nr:hypothetical protein Metme_0560 [Methylomonas methanica MC09]
MRDRPLNNDVALAYGYRKTQVAPGCAPFFALLKRIK